MRCILSFAVHEEENASLVDIYTSQFEMSEFLGKDIFRF